MRSRFFVAMLIATLLLTLTGCGTLVPGGRLAQQAGPSAEEVAKAEKNLLPILQGVLRGISEIS